MSKKIYVGNLPYKVDEDTLREMFEKIGEIQSVKIIKDAMTGRSKGFGFIEMTSDEDADKAISTLNGTTLMERTIIVSEARPQQTSRHRRSNSERKRRPYTGGRESRKWK